MMEIKTPTTREECIELALMIRAEFRKIHEIMDGVIAKLEAEAKQ